jgi:hypothetical protein
MAAKQKSSGQKVGKPQAEAAVVEESAFDAAGRYVGQWNRLVSTTNWEKGRIICQWRDALVAVGAAVTDYSDEAWSQLVGGVTSQHVGRLRRVFQRFGDAFDQYQGLYWSHFQAALDWEDAEMWLEGAIHNHWSVSQMRGKRWETVGKPGELMPAGDEIETDEVDVDEPQPIGESGVVDDAVTSHVTTVKSADAPAASAEEDDAEEDEAAFASNGAADHEPQKSPARSRSRLAVEVDELSEDIAEAFEQFKLAIIAQRRLGWSETTPEAVLECLDALRELALAPADD